MNENDCEECLNPKISNAWDRQKTFFGVAAAQSSVGKANPYLPESLLSPLVTVLDPCTLSASIHTQVDWKLVEPRLVRNNIMSKQRIAPRRVIQKDMDTSSDFEFNSDGCGSRSDSPLYLGRTPRANNGERSEPIYLTNFEDAEENLMKKEKDIFIDEIVDLIRNVRKHNDASLASSQTWVDTLLVDKISKQLILIQSYLPQMLSVEEIVNALLFENGPAVLENLLIEMPEHVVAIVNVLTKSLMQGSKGRYRNLVIGRVLTLYPYFVRRVIEKFSKNRSDCVFACRLAVDHLDDKQFLQFLEPMLTEKESLLSKIVLRSSGRQVLPMVIDRLLAMAEVVNEYDMNAPPGTPSPEMGVSPWCTRLAFCLVELLNLTLETWQERDIVIITRFVFRTSATPSSSTESGMLADEPMDFSTMHDSVDSVVPDSDPETSQSVVARPKVSPGESVEDSPFGDAHESFVLSALIAVPFFTQYPINNTGAVQPPDRAVDNWLDIARKRALVGDKVTSTFCVNLIYVHSCIMSSRIDELAEFASDGMKQRIELSSRHNHAHVLKNAFTSRCMTEIEVAKRSVCQRVAKCEGGDRSDQLALKSIHALQATGVYKTFQIDIRTWLEEQLDNISLPASELLAEVVDGFAQFSAHHNGKGLSDEFLKKTYSGDLLDGRTVPKRLFVLLYLCSYREAAQRLDSALRNLSFDASIYRQMPVRYLLSVMEQYHDEYEFVRPKIITRAAIIFPYMMPTPVSMNLVAVNQKTADMEVLEEGEQLESKIADWIKMLSEHKEMAKILEAIDRSSLREQLAALPLAIDIFMKTLDPLTPQGFEHSLISIFNRFEQLDPRSLFELSAVTWLRDDDVTIDDVMKIPSLLFRCDRRILSSPPHFHCFVRALNFFNKMVRAENRLKMLMAQQKVINASQGHRLNFFYSEVERKEKELLNAAYLDTQHSVLVHALIECCDSKRMKDDPNDFALAEKRQQIRRIACQYMHRTFLDYEGLIRIVLHQKFPLRQIRDLVENIPALFAGNAQILEMLSLTDQQRRFFAIVFAAEICRKYRVRESLETARIVCDIVHSLHKFGQLPSSHKVWKYVAPALMLLATEFPSLADSITRLLQRVVAMAKNRLAVRCGFLACNPENEEYLLINMISSFLDRNSLPDRL